MTKNAVIALIQNPLHGNRQYKHKFGSRSKIDKYLNHPDRVHLKVVTVRPLDIIDVGMPYTLK
jgi:hypothetical protein